MTRQIGHVGDGVDRSADEQLFYLMSRGLSEAQDDAMVVSGFIEQITRPLPIGVAVERSRRIGCTVEPSRCAASSWPNCSIATASAATP